MNTIGTRTWIILVGIVAACTDCAYGLVHPPKETISSDFKNALVRNTADPSMTSEAEQKPKRNSRRVKSA